jgi:hypothetical protein
MLDGVFKNYIVYAIKSLKIGNLRIHCIWLFNFGHDIYFEKKTHTKIRNTLNNSVHLVNV